MVRHHPSPAPKPRLSIVIPAYNEQRRLAETLPGVLAWCQRQSEDCEILVVDDGSTDGTASVAKELLSGACGRVLVSSRNFGKGHAVRTGMLAALGDEILFSDADWSSPITELAKLRAALAEGADIAIGSRAVPGRTLGRRQPRSRELLGKAFNLVVQLLAVRGIKDTQCGFKLFRRDCARQVFGRVRHDGFVFDVEALFLARRLGFTITEVAVHWSHSDDTRVQVGADGLRMVRDVLRLRSLHASLATELAAGGARDAAGRRAPIR